MISPFQESKSKPLCSPGWSPATILIKSDVCVCHGTSVSSPTQKYKIPGKTRPAYTGLSPLCVILAYLPGQLRLNLAAKRETILTLPMKTLQWIPQWMGLKSPLILDLEKAKVKKIKNKKLKKNGNFFHAARGGVGKTRRFACSTGEGKRKKKNAFFVHRGQRVGKKNHISLFKKKKLIFWLQNFVKKILF